MLLNKITPLQCVTKDLRAAGKLKLVVTLVERSSMRVTKGTSRMRERWIPGHFSSPTWPGYEANKLITSSVGRTCWEHKERTDVQDVGEIFQWCELSIKTEETVVQDADDIGK